MIHMVRIFENVSVELDQTSTLRIYPGRPAWQRAIDRGVAVMWGMLAGVCALDFIMEPSIVHGIFYAVTLGIAIMHDK